MAINSLVMSGANIGNVTIIYLLSHIIKHKLQTLKNLGNLHLLPTKIA